MTATRLSIITILALAASVLACTKAVVQQERDPNAGVIVKDAPPAQAPANGARMKHGDKGVELVYDADIDVYVVQGVANCYYSAGQYLRFESRVWEWSASIDGPWKHLTCESDLPPGLRHRHGKGHMKKDDT